MAGRLRLKNQRGLLLVEIILGIAIFSVLTFVALSAFVYSEDSTAVSGDNMRAAEVVNAIIEGLHNMSDSSYATLSGFTIGTTYYFTNASSQWALTTAPTTIDSIYTPTVVFSTGPISNSLEITAAVSWKEDAQREGSVSATTYFSEWGANTTVPIQTKTGLLVYANGGTTTELIDYRLLQSGGTWTNPAPLPVVDPTTDNEVARSVKIYPAQTGANKVVLARFYDGTDQYLYGIVWNGSTWGNVQLLTKWAGDDGLDSGNYSGSYMVNGTFVAVYDDNTDVPKYNTWNGTTWSAQGSLPTLTSGDRTDFPESMIVQARPGANEAMAVMLGNDFETDASFYNGTSWSAMTALATNGTSDSTKNVDFAWSPVNTLQGAAMFTNSGNDRALQFSIFTDNGKGSGTWGSIISTSNQPSGSISESVDIAAQPSGTEEWIACDKDSEADQHIYCFTLLPTVASNPVNQIIATNSANGGQQSFDLGFGLLSGTTGLNAYSDNTTSVKLKTFNSATNTWETTPIAAPTAEAIIYKTHVIPEPGSNDAMVLMIDSNNNLYSIMYDSSTNSFYTSPPSFAWTIHNANGPSVDAKWFDFAWDQ